MQVLSICTELPYVTFFRVEFYNVQIDIGWTACIGYIFFWVNFSEILKHEVRGISGEV